jgi:hypothetical protein
VRRLYGLELEEYIRLKAAGCYVCGSTERVGMDHCHVTNSLRAPLCHSCNMALGYAKDDAQRLEALANYVREMAKPNAKRKIPSPSDPRRIHMDSNDLRSMYEGGMTQAEIAQAYGCTPPLIVRRMKEHGIATRPRGRRVTAL